MQRVPFSISSFLGPWSLKTALLYTAVFIVQLSVLKLAQYVFFTYDTSPAIVISASGTALAIVLVFGYHTWIPIALAQLVSNLTSPALASPLIIATTVTIYTIQPLIGAYMLRRFGFELGIKRTRDAILIITAALVVTAIAPTVLTLVRMYLGELEVSPWINWSRLWAGGVLSVMVVTSFIISWIPYLTQVKWLRMTDHLIERIAAGSALIAIVYAIFWTSLPEANVFIVLYIFFGVLFWIGLRMGPRFMTLAIFFTTVFAIIGIFNVDLHDQTLGSRLLATELFIILVAPIFLILTTLVSERKDIAEAHQKNIERLENALSKISSEDAAKNEFIAILAHELRNPLAPIVSSLELLKLQELSPEMIEMLEDAENNTHTMKRLLDDLLDVTRVAQKKFNLRKEHIELKTIIDQSVRMARDLMNARHHTLVVRLPEEPVQLFVDRVRFQQIVVNLLNNAAKYTENNGYIELTARATPSELILEVNDNGIGIPKEHLETIFSPFRQVPGDHPSGGLGIGLYLTRKLIEMHGGTVSVASGGQGSGSTFTIKLPLETSPQHITPPITPPSMEQHSSSLKVEADRRKILLVDDNVQAAVGLKKLLEYKGYTVILAHTGLEALVSLGNEKPDYILLDIGLPDTTGYEVAREIRERGINTILIALTGYGQEEDRIKAREAGFDYHLVKPVSIVDVELILVEASKEHDG